MTNFTPSELLYVAETTIPKKKWRLGTREGWDDTLVINTHEPDTELWPDVYNPETNDTQFRKLAEWCADRGIVVFLDGEHTAYQVQSDGNLSHIVREDGSQLFNVLARGNTHTDCMIAAVLVLEESEK